MAFSATSIRSFACPPRPGNLVFSDAGVRVVVKLMSVALMISEDYDWCNVSVPVSG